MSGLEPFWGLAPFKFWRAKANELSQLYQHLSEKFLPRAVPLLMCVYLKMQPLPSTILQFPCILVCLKGVVESTQGIAAW